MEFEGILKLMIYSIYHFNSKNPSLDMSYLLFNLELTAAEAHVLTTIKTTNYLLILFSKDKILSF
ncbi:hypothetical protein BpHYR1_051151 [Brachionus plicatilis]|uniref:Uncharacterized protein n=1 Tax=Brachionus plicatilis TaxID=10195 RepID=A0A3M7SV17_BRAPC|nr:hypothetical protein BpHYR1_051151 [Brachionus plicatilis]